MVKLAMIVNNQDSLKHQIINTLKNHEGKFVSSASALKNVKDFALGMKALQELVQSGEIIAERNQKHGFTMYRFPTENTLLRPDAPKVALSR